MWIIAPSFSKKNWSCTVPLERRGQRCEKYKSFKFGAALSLPVKTPWAFFWEFPTLWTGLSDATSLLRYVPSFQTALPGEFWHIHISWPWDWGIPSVRGVVVPDLSSFLEMVNRWMKIMKKRWFWCFQPVETGCRNSSRLHFLQPFHLAKALKI